jgi:hypothetical protein
MRKYWPFIIPAALLGMVVFTFIGGEVVKLLWNWLGPPLFNLPLLSFWQALALLALCRILFGGFGFHGGGHAPYRGRMADRMADRMVDRVADRFSDRWQNMSSEERERFRQRVRERCGFDPGGSENKEQ